MRIRPAAPSDGPLIAELQVASWRAAYRGILADAYLDGPMADERRAVWRRRITEALDPDQVIVLAESGSPEGPLGFCCILAGEHPAWGSLIDNLHVRPGHWRRRLGRDLLRAAARLVPVRHAATPLHLTVFEANARAIAAYERWGGSLVERLSPKAGDGRILPIRRYAWADPADLVGRIDRAG